MKNKLHVRFNAILFNAFSMRLLVFTAIVSFFAVMSCQKDFTFGSKSVTRQNVSVTMSIDEAKSIFQKEISRSDTSTQDTSLRGCYAYIGPI